MAHCNLASHRGGTIKGSWEVGLDIGQINNLMETGLDGQKPSAQVFIRQLISQFLICTQPDKGGGEILRGLNAKVGE